MIRRSLGLLRSLIVYWRPGRQPRLRRLYAPFVGAGDLVFDVGAHLGDRTAAFASLGAQVVAVEPQPELVPWLRRLVGRRPGVVIRQYAVGAAPGSAPLAVSDTHPTVSTLAAGWRARIGEVNPTFRRVQWERTVDVSVTTLDELIREFGEPRFCKIDVEGFEVEVLTGLSRPIACLSVEWVSGCLDVTQGCIDRLAELGEYEFNVIPGEERRFVFPNWQTSVEIREWLRLGAGGSSSGDLYARLRGGRR